MKRFMMTEEEYQRVVNLEKKIRDKNISRRLKALMLRCEGKKDREIAERLGVHRASVSAMCMRYMREGLEEYARNKYTSHNRLLSEETEAAILEKFRCTAEAGREV